MSFADEFLAARPTAALDLNGKPLECRATTRRGTPCQRMPLPHNGYCPSHQHLAETEEVPQPVAGVLRRHGARPASVQIAPMLLGVDVGGTFTDAVLAVGRTAGHRQGADDPGRPVRGRAGRGRRRARAGRARGAGRRGVRARHDRRDQRAARGPRRAHGARRHRGLHRRRRARPPGARRPLPAVRRASGAARPAGAARRRARAHGARRRAARARRTRPRLRRRASRALEPEAVAVCLLHSYRHPEHEQALGAALRERLPGVHVSLSHEVVGTFREYERAATTEVDAALSPLLAALPAALAERAARRGPAGAGDHAVQRRPGRRSSRRARTPR